MRRILILICFFIVVNVSGKTIVLTTSYDSYKIDDLAKVVRYFDFITKQSKIYTITELDVQNDGSYRIVSKYLGEYYLFEVYEANNKSFIGQYKREKTDLPAGNSPKLFETPIGKIDADEFRKFYVGVIDTDIQNLGLSGDAAEAYRQQAGQILDEMNTGDITKLNTKGGFEVKEGSKFKDYSNWQPNVQKANWWGKNIEGKSDVIVKDVDYARNAAIGEIRNALNRWEAYKAPEGATEIQWIFKMRSEIKSIYVE